MRWYCRILAVPSILTGKGEDKFIMTEEPLREEILLTQQVVCIESSNSGTYEGAVGSFVFDWLTKKYPAEVRREPVHEGRNNIASMTGCRNCMSFGPGSLEQAHRPNEFVPCGEIVRSMAVMTVLAEDILLDSQ